MMNEITVIEREGKRVLTTAQLAEAYGTDAKIVNRNFQRNSDRYIEGKHFFVLSGEDLKEFKGSRQIDDSFKFASILYLWTEKGALFHAKSLNTDEAWMVYDMLVDNYFQKREPESSRPALPQTYKEALQHLLVQVERNEMLETTIVQQTPKVESFDTFMDKGDCLAMDEVAKTLQLPFGRNKLYEVLRKIGVLQTATGRKNHPYQAYVNQGYFEMKQTIKNGIHCSVTLVTPKGLVWLEKGLRNMGYMK